MSLEETQSEKFLFYEDEDFTLYKGKMQDVLSTFEENSIDSIVCDPPYELNFMNKGWDNSGVAFKTDTWKHCFRVLKEGGYLLAFGGSRTFHRIACAIEDAGFEIRDTIMYLYGCYSSDTQVLTDKGWKYFYDLDKTEKIMQWDKDTNKLSWIKPLNYFEYDIEDDMVRLENRHTEQLLTKNHRVVCDIKKNHKKYSGAYSFIEAQNILKTDFIKLPLASYYYGNLNYEYAYMVGWWLTDAWKHKDGKGTNSGSGCYNCNDGLDGSMKKEYEERIAQNEWKGWGTTLKPAYEPIIVARKPFKGSLIDNVIKNGVGGLNIDECRVDATGEIIGRNNPNNPFSGIFHSKNTKGLDTTNINNGRFPANVITDGSEEVAQGMPNTKSVYNLNGKHETEIHRENADFLKYGYKERFETGYNDEGSAMRYFYCAKASKKDRDEGLDMFEEKQVGSLAGGDNQKETLDDVSSRFRCIKKNIHPTVKNVLLMQYLVRLVSPKGAKVLDCFMGSGSTGKACMFENRERNANYHFIGIEMTDEYLPIAKARIDYAKYKYQYDEIKEKEERKEKGIQTIFDFDFSEVD